jgi:acetyl esterase/lipase
VNLTGAGALGGAFWGLLFGLLFFMPFFGLAVGAVMGGLAGRVSDYGIDDDFIKSVRDQVTEGTSALFLLTVTGSAALDKLQDELKGKMGSLIKSNLTNVQEAKLRKAFGEDKTGWKIESQTLPPPAGASDVMRTSIANTSQPDVEAMRQVAPRTKEEWLAVITETDAPKEDVLQTLLNQFPISVQNDEIAGVPVFNVTPAEVDPRHENHLFIYVHGGAYILNRGKVGVMEAIIIAQRCQMPVLSIDYRMPPEHPFPAGMEDVVVVYRHLLEQHPAASLALGGTSAGGGLILATTSKLIKLGIDVPGALYAGTPWADLTKTGDSYIINQGVDRLLITYDGLLEGAARLYAGNNDLKDPLISPVYGKFHDFPPTFLVTGTRDLFLSNTARTHTKMRATGVVADLLVFEGVSHGDYAFEPTSPESLQTYAELNAFLLRHLQ